MSDDPWPLATESSAAKLLNNHAADMGHVAMAWTRLHEELGKLFAVVVTPDRMGVGTSVWHSIISDRGQRAALAAGAQSALGETNELYERLKWGLDQLTTLENDRNNTLHSAFGLMIEDGAFRLIPIDYTGNPRARNLRGKDLGIELRSYAQNIHAIRQYFERLGLCHFYAQRNQHVPWPAKPRLPRPAQAGTQKASHPKKSGKSLSPRPQS